MKFLKLPLVPFAFLCVIAIRILARFGFLVRFGDAWSHRIGHCASHAELYLCERDAGMQKGYDIWLERDTKANAYLSKMLRRVLRTDRTGFARIVWLCNTLFKGHEKHSIETAQYDRDIHNLYERFPAHLKFTEDEIAFGYRAAKRLGIPYGAKWVCLIVRDSGYLPKFTYHSFRDSSIDSYMFAVGALVARGYYVVRMGVDVKETVGNLGDKFIDYATSGQRTEFMDIYLGAHCEFCLSNGCGFDSIPTIFRRPICYVNMVPLEYLATYVNPSLAIWKHHYKDGKCMTPAEIYESGMGQALASGNFESAGVTLVDNSPEEIADVAMEMANLIEGGVPADTGNHVDPQALFWADFPRNKSPFNDRPLHGEVRMRIGAKFLREYD